MPLRLSPQTNMELYMGYGLTFGLNLGYKFSPGLIWPMPKETSLYGAFCRFHVRPGECSPYNIEIDCYVACLPSCLQEDRRRRSAAPRKFVLWVQHVHNPFSHCKENGAKSDNKSFLFFHERYSSPFAGPLLYLVVMIFLLSSFNRAGRTFSNKPTMVPCALRTKALAFLSPFST